MRHFLKKVCLCLLAICAASPAPAKEPVLEGIVSDVFSGDTVAVTIPSGEKIKIHLYGIDSPKKEKRDAQTGMLKRPGQLFGEEAFQALKGKLQNQKVKVEIIGNEGRSEKQMGIIRLDKRNIGLEMVREGLAWAHQSRSKGILATEYGKAEEQARGERRGLWKQDNPQPPWEFIKLWKMKEALLIGSLQPGKRYESPSAAAAAA